MKIKARHRLIPAVAMLIVAAIALTSASYAWFTMSRTVKADSISLKAVAPSNLKISKDNTSAASYVEAVSIALDSAATNNYGLIPVSSPDGVSFFAPVALTGTTGAPDPDTTDGTEFVAVDLSQAANKLVSDGTETADGYYIDIPLWIATEGTEDVEVGISTAISSITGSVGTTQIANAARVAVLKATGTTTANITATATAAAPVPKASVVTDYILANDVTYFTATPEILPVNKADVGSDAWAYETEAKTAMEGRFLLKTEDLTAANTATSIMTVPKQTAGTPSLTTVNTPIIVRIWIEGQDADCVNDAVKDLAVTIGFKDVTYAE